MKKLGFMFASVTLAAGAAALLGALAIRAITWL